MLWSLQSTSAYSVHSPDLLFPPKHNFSKLKVTIPELLDDLEIVEFLSQNLTGELWHHRPCSIMERLLMLNLKW